MVVERFEWSYWQKNGEEVMQYDMVYYHYEGTKSFSSNNAFQVLDVANVFRRSRFALNLLNHLYTYFCAILRLKKAFNLKKT